MEKVSAIIVNYNSWEFLDRCLTSLVSQTHKPHRIIVVDNSDQDRFTSVFKKRWSEVVIVRSGKNVGFAAANNHGVKMAADSRWIALLNPDAFPTPTWLENLLRTARQNPPYGFFGSRMLMAGDSARLDGTGDVYHTSGLVWRRGHGCSGKNFDLKAREIFSPCAAAALFLRDAFMEAGGFDEDYFCFSEDVDLGFRLRLLGYRCLYVPDAIVYHIGSSVTGKHSDFSIYQGHRNLVWSFFKNMPLPLLLYYLPQHILLNFITVLWFAWKGRGRTILRSKRDALKGLSGVLNKRKRIQSRRKIRISDLREIMDKGFPSKLTTSG